MVGEPAGYEVVLADPPWRYASGSSPPTRRIENHYPTMSLDEIRALPVASLAADDAVLYLWATAPKLAEALGVLAAWSFVYRSCMVWVKVGRLGMGYWSRVNHELLLVGARGRPRTPASEVRPDSVFRSPVRAHSAKPDLVYELLERAYPDRSRIELFARHARLGWHAWGNEGLDEPVRQETLR